MGYKNWTKLTYLLTNLHLSHLSTSVNLCKCTVCKKTTVNTEQQWHAEVFFSQLSFSEDQSRLGWVNQRSHKEPLRNGGAIQAGCPSCHPTNNVKTLKQFYRNFYPHSAAAYNSALTTALTDNENVNYHPTLKFRKSWWALSVPRSGKGRG